MNTHMSWLDFCLGVFFIAILSVSVETSASDYPMKEDVSSIDGIMNAYYGVVSGPAGFKYDHERDQSLYGPNAIITRFRDNGRFERNTVAKETQPLEAWAEGFYEIEINRIVEQFGNLAHVWSTFEIRGTPEGAALSRGISSVSLYYRDNRWWLASWSTQNETDVPLPFKYAPNPKVE